MHANAVEFGGTPESAVARAMERASVQEPIPETSGAVRLVW
jgi:hypothetical protein